MISKCLFYKSIDIIITWLYDIVLTGKTPAYIAAKQRKWYSLKVLAEHGADLNLENSDGKLIHLYLHTINIIRLIIKRTVYFNNIIYLCI